MISGWEPLTVKDDARKVYLKPELTWSKEEDEKSLGNSHVSNALYNGVDQSVFKLINTYVH